jgi:PAS domain S-box-containing protein
MASAIEKKIRIGIAILFAALVINGLASYRATRTLISNEQWVTHTYQVIGEIEGILSTLKDAETGERGYIITGADTYLQPYEIALTQIDGRIRHLEMLTADNPAQQARIPILENKIADRLEGLKTGINLRKNGDIEGAHQLIQGGSGKRMMEELRRFIDEMETEENGLLQQRADESRISARAANLTFVIGNIITICLLLAIGYIIDQDVAARVLSEHELRAQRQLLQVTLSSIADGVIACDTEGSVTFLNPVAESLTGWRQQEAGGQPLIKVFDIINEQTRQAVQNPALRAIREGTVVGLANHTVLRTKYGNELPIDDCASPIKAADGALLGAVLVFRDVTQRRRAERDLVRSHEWTDSILTSISDAFYVFDRDWRFTYINEKGLAMARKSREELIGKVVWEVFPDLAGTALQREYEQVMTGRAPGNIEFYYPAFKMWFGHRIFPFSDGVTTYVTDITERRKAEEQGLRLLAETESARAQAEAANRTKDEFLATLSHELRTPLTAIYGWVDLLKHSDLEEKKVTKALEVIDRNVKAQTQLIDDLLNVSRIITGNLKMDMQLIDPLPFTRMAIDSLRPALEAKSIELVTRLDEHTGPIHADPVRWQQVLWNLFTNAMKFTPRGGEIRVEFGRVGSSVRLTVADNGEGIEPGFLPYVFDRFTQSDSTTTRRHGGLGLGLAIVRHIVELHGGKARVHSDGRGKGSTFVVELPVPPFQDEDRHTSKSTTTRNLNGLRVMLVEDDEDTREVVSATLASYGASVIEAASAAEALRLLVTENPDVLVTDIGMPGMDGYELLEKVRSESRQANIPAVALTAFASPEDRQKSLRAGFRAHISKPIEVEELIAAIGATRERPDG